MFSLVNFSTSAISTPTDTPRIRTLRQVVARARLIDPEPDDLLFSCASNGKDVDYHLFPIAPPPGDGLTIFKMAAFLLRSSGQGKVRLGKTPDEGLQITAPPLPEDGIDRLRHAF